MASAHMTHMKQDIIQPTKERNVNRLEREKTIVARCNNRHSIDVIWRVSGLSNRGSVLHILNKYRVSLNRGKFSRSLGKHNPKEE